MRNQRQSDKRSKCSSCWRSPSCKSPVHHARHCCAGPEVMIPWKALRRARSSPVSLPWPRTSGVFAPDQGWGSMDFFNVAIHTSPKQQTTLEHTKLQNVPVRVCVCVCHIASAKCNGSWGSGLWFASAQFNVLSSSSSELDCSDCKKRKLMHMSTSFQRFCRLCPSSLQTTIQASTPLMRACTRAYIYINP